MSVKRVWTVYEVRVYKPIILTIVVLALNKSNKWRVVQDDYNFSSLLVYNNKEQIHIIKFQFVIIFTSLRRDRKKGNDVKLFFLKTCFFSQACPFPNWNTFLSLPSLVFYDPTVFFSSFFFSI